MNADEREELIDLKFGELITARRELVRYSSAQLARFSSIPLERIIELENGMPKIGVRKWEIERLSKILGLPKSILLEFATGEKQNHEDEKKSHKEGESKSKEAEVEHLH